MVDRRVKVTAELDARGMVEGAKQAESAVAKTGQAMKRTAGQTEDAAKGQESAFKRMARSAQENERAWTTAGTAITAFGAVTTAALVTSAKAAVDWESAFAGVKKTVDDSEAGYAALSAELRDMAKTLPAAHEEIAGVAEAAGQLGISRESLTDFTRTMIDLGETTNLSADQAATSLARFANVMGTSQDEFDNIGSALVGLGNNFATTEAEIVDMSMRLAGAGRQAGLTEGDVLGLATALSSVGIESEAGGTAFSRVLTEMGIAVDTQDEKLRTFAEVAGMTADQFREAWASDSGGAVTAFVEGLGRIQESGESLEPVLDELGMTDIRIGDALRRSASASDIFSEAIARGNEEYELNNALTAEAAQRYETTAAKLAVFRNNVRDAAISLGEQFLPALEAIAGLGSDVASWLSDLPDPMQKIAAYGGAAAGGVSLMAGGFLLLAPRALETYDALKKIGIITPGVTSALGKMRGVLLGPWGLAIAGAVAAIGMFVAAKRDYKAAVDDYITTLDEETSALTDNTREHIANLAATEGALEWANDLGLRKGLVADILMGDADAMREFQAATEGVEEAWHDSVDAFGNGDAQLKRTRDATRDLSKWLEDQGVKLADSQAQHARLREEVEGSGAGFIELTGAIVDTIPAVREFAEANAVASESTDEWLSAQDRAIRLGDEAAQAYRTWVDEIKASSDAFVTASGALSTVNTATQEWAQAQADATDDAEDSWEDFWDGQSVSIDEWIAELERMAQAQADWEVNMLMLSTRVSEGVLDELRRLGPEGAPLVAELVDASDTELARLEAVFGTRAEEGLEAFGQAMTNTDVLTALGARWGEDIMAEVAGKLASGEMTLQQVVDAYDLSATIAMLGDDAPFAATLGAALGMATEAEPVVDINGNSALFSAELGAALGEANISEATAKILGDSSEFGSTLGVALGKANDSEATADIAGNASGSGLFYSTLDSALYYASRQSATVSIYARLMTSVSGIMSTIRSRLGAIGLPGWMAGGYTGDGATTEVAGFVHGKEFVSKAETTADPYNRAALEFMHSGNSIREWQPPIPAAASLRSAAGGGESIDYDRLAHAMAQVSFGVNVDGREIARAAARGSAELGGRLNA